MWTSVCSIDVQSNRRRLHKTISETRPSNVTPFVLDGCWALDGLDQPTMRWLSNIAKRFRFDPACHVGTVQQTARDQELHGDLTWRGGHESARCSSNRLSAPVECSQFVAEGFQLRILHLSRKKCTLSKYARVKTNAASI